MSHRYYARLRRYAALSAVQAVVVLVAALSAALTLVPGVVFVLAGVAMFWAWGPFQAEIALNERLDDISRRRWRVLLVVVPGAMALYFHRHVRRP
jgi:hypothetical protein